MSARVLVHVSVAALAVVAASCECGSHTRPPADAALDVPDTGPFVCGTPIGPYFEDGLCTPERDIECQRWAQALTPTGTAISRCQTSMFGAGAGCTAGLIDCDVAGACFCASREVRTCVGNEVCVSDPPGSTPHCAVICTQEEPSP